VCTRVRRTRTPYRLQPDTGALEAWAVCADTPPGWRAGAARVPSGRGVAPPARAAGRRAPAPENEEPTMLPGKKKGRLLSSRGAGPRFAVAAVTARGCRGRPRHPPHPLPSAEERLGQ